MAADRDSDWRDLNGHADGELDAASRARMAERIAGDRELARGAAVLARLRAETAGAFLAEAEEIASPKLSVPAPRPRMGRWWLAAAAVLLVVLAAAGLQATYLSASDPAIEAHLRWTDTPPAAMRTRVSARHPGFPSGVPGLDAAGLQMVRAVTEGNALHVGYLGPRGCRISLWIAPAGKEADFVTETRDSLTIARWAGRGFGYAVIAGGMPPARFVRIASALHEASMNPSVTRQLFAEGNARETEARCLG